VLFGLTVSSGLVTRTSCPRCTEVGGFGVGCLNSVAEYELLTTLVYMVYCVCWPLCLFLYSAGMGNKSKYMIGDGTNLVDFTYVENVAYAHLLAAVKLAPSAKIHGQVR